MIYPKNYDVIIIGTGHAGIEAGLATARMGCQTLIVTINLDTIAQMPCNPSIGGPAKGHLTREIDALGGEMGKAIDKTHLHIRMLNTGKGPAVWALRAQADKKLYHQYMKHLLEKEENLELKQELVEEILIKNDKICGIKTQTKVVYKAPVVIVTTGTFLSGVIHIGENIFPAGRAGEFSAVKLSESLKNIGLNLGRLKTGTTPRVDKRTINYDITTRQEPSDRPLTFSFQSPRAVKPGQLCCYLTYTTQATKDIITKNFHRAPLFSGQIKATGPRYCPSIEDKLRKFPDKDSHQVFLEPEGFDTQEVYVQGMATSLPVDVQIGFLRTIIGLEKVEMMRPGYAIEYDFVPPTQLWPTLETKKIKGLFLAGQINGTSGYEEAAAQGLLAGINAVLGLQGKGQVVLPRWQAYMGVLTDDLVTKGVEDPYRMLTSRAEYRLVLRQDNADERLTPLGYKLGLIKEKHYKKFKEKMNNIKQEIERLKNRRLSGKDNLEKIQQVLKTPLESGLSFYEILKRPEILYEGIKKIDKSAPELSEEEAQQVEIKIKYEGYIKRQEIQIAQDKKTEELEIPLDFDFNQISSLSREAKEKFSRVLPKSIGQAGRISGLTPADLSVLIIYVQRHKKRLQTPDSRHQTKTDLRQQTIK